MALDAPNIQALWGDLIVEELVRAGVEYFVIAPGSRNTPLVQAVARNAEARAVVWTDERGAAFHALGWGRGSDAPAAVVTTSGTAVANLLPAVVEASLDAVPLLLLTADRPPELREVGANQSIRQTNIFSDYLRWSFDLPVPDDRTPARMVLTTVDHAVQRAMDDWKGPVQINCPFREPLAPDEEPWDRACLQGLEAWQASDSTFTRTVMRPGGCPLHKEWEHESVVEKILEVGSGLIVAGSSDVANGHLDLAHLLGWPLWPDVRSGLRIGPLLIDPKSGNDAVVLPHADRILGHGFEPEMVIQIGGRLTSKRLQQYLDSGAVKHHVVVDAGPARLDPGHRVTERHQADPEHWCDSVWECALKREDQLRATRLEDWATLDARIERALEDAVEAGGALSEPWVARWLSRNLDADHGLFVSNSMPIRDLQNYAVLNRPALRLAANRGASGIDGVVSTAAGFSQVIVPWSKARSVSMTQEEWDACTELPDFELGAPTTLLIGDLALLHDLNALAHLHQLDHPLTIVLLNNGGGGIFSFLPVAAHADVLTPLVQTPHDLVFEGVCKTFGLGYARVGERAAFEQAYRDAIASGRPALIEVQSSLEGNRAEHERIEALIEEAIAAGGAA